MGRSRLVAEGEDPVGLLSPVAARRQERGSVLSPGRPLVVVETSMSVLRVCRSWPAGPLWGPRRMGGAVSAHESSVRAERRRARNPPRYFAIRTRSAYSALSWPISSCVNRGQRRKSGARSSSRSDPWWTRSSASIAVRSSGSSFTPETFPGGAPRKRLCRTFLRRRVSSAHALGISFSLQ